MLQIIKEKYPDLKVQSQSKYLHDKYGYTVEIKYIGCLLDDNFRKHTTTPISLRTTKQINRSLPTGEGNLHLEVARQIFQHLVEPWENKQIASRYNYMEVIRLYFQTPGEVVELVDLIQNLETRYQTPKLISLIKAVPENLSMGELAVTNPALSEYQYRVMLRDFRFQDQKNFIGLLKTYQTDIKMHWMLERLVTANKQMASLYMGQWVHNADFYSKNSEILTFLSLASPALIRKIYRLNHQQ